MMVNSVLKMRRALGNIRDNPGKDEDNIAGVVPSDEDFDLFDETIPVLEKIGEISELLSADIVICINRVMSHLFNLQALMNKKLNEPLSNTAECFIR